MLSWSLHMEYPAGVWTLIANSRILALSDDGFILPSATTLVVIC